MSVNPLVVTIEATHESLAQRLAEARHVGQMTTTAHRERFVRTDAFMSGASRHLAAVEDVLLDAGHQDPETREAADAYLHAARDLEHALALVKARLYGEVHAAHLTWPEVWDGVAHALERHNAQESALVQLVVRALDERESAALAERVYRAELHAPTRAHPYIPHHGRVGHLARRLWALADRFWDTAEGRSVPRLVYKKPREHGHDSLMGQYLLGEPHFDAEAPVFGDRDRTATDGTTANPPPT